VSQGLLTNCRAQRGGGQVRSLRTPIESEGCEGYLRSVEHRGGDKLGRTVKEGEQGALTLCRAQRWNKLGHQRKQVTQEHSPTVRHREWQVRTLKESERAGATYSLSIAESSEV
jgi:hypothetical protein